MYIPRTQRKARQGFTLIELLMVILIIAILLGLTAAGIFKFLKLGPSTQNKSEISQLEGAIAEFHRSFQLGKEYFPSQIKLCQFLEDYGTTQLDIDSKAFLTRMFPRIQSTYLDASGTQQPPIWSVSNPGGTGINWSSNAGWGTAGTSGRVAVLEGDQCLVFFLGGIPATDGTTGLCLGFSSSSRNPADFTVTTRKPFYEFDASRLQDFHSSTNPGFWSYKDVYGTQPYLYFSSYKTRNGYNRYGATDCPSAGVSPYLASSTTFVYPSKFQIISAGADHMFGAGGIIWNPDAAAPDLKSKDDQTNFSDTLLFVDK